MPELTKEQQRLLIWLSLPSTHFEICRELGSSYRKMNGLESYVDWFGDRYKFDNRTLQKLIDTGLVTSEFLYPFGINYERYYVTEEGQTCIHEIRFGAS
jgi:hypothetical protein